VKIYLTMFFESLTDRLIASRNNILAFYHQDYGAFWRACPMPHALGHDESLTRSKIDSAILEIDQKTACNYVKEFIQIFMRMPMVFALDDPEPHHRIVHFAKRLVPPFVRACVDELLQIDHFQRLVQNVQICLVRIIFLRFHGSQFSAGGGG